MAGDGQRGSEDDKMKVGDKVWIFDTNRRVYPKVNGRVTGGPIYAEHFVQAEITGETSKSWIVREGQRETSPVSILMSRKPTRFGLDVIGMTLCG